MTDWWADVGAAPSAVEPKKTQQQTAAVDWWADANDQAKSSIASLDPSVPSGAPQPPVSTAADVAKSAASGVVRGFSGLAGLPGDVSRLADKGLNAAFSYFMPETMARANAARQTYGKEAPKLGGQDIVGAIEGVTGPLYKPQTTAGEYARTVGEFAPGALAPGGIVQRVVGNVVLPAVGSETAGQLTEGTALEPYARVGGALLGAVAPSAAARVVSPVKGGGAERAKNVKLLESEGVTSLTAGQKTGSKPLRWAESTIGDMPFTGGRAASLMEEQAEQFTRAALKRAGINANRATPEVLDDAFTRIGKEFDTIAANAKVPASRKLSRDINQIVRDYYAVTPQTMRADIVNDLATDVFRAAGQGGLSGPQYVAWRSQLDRAARNAAGNPQLSDALQGLRNALDSAVERGLPKSLTDRWRTARNEYRNIIAIERAAVAGGEAAAEGLISPAALKNAVKVKHGVRNYARGKGDLAALARAGDNVMKPLPQSGTAPRAAFQNMTQIIGAGIGGGAAGLPGAVAGAALPAVAGRTIMSKPAQAYLSNQAAAPIRNAMMSRASMSGAAPGVYAGINPAESVPTQTYPEDVPSNALLRSMWASPEFQAYLNGR